VNRISDFDIESMDDLFLKEKPVRALTRIVQLRGHYSSNTDDVYPMSLAKEIDSTYAHTTKIVGQLEDLGLSREKRRAGRISLNLPELARK